MTAPGKKVRLTYLDVARGMTMILIVAFHVFGGSSSLFHHFVASMCLPIFFFISGFFGSFHPWKDFQRLIFPFWIVLIAARMAWCIRLGEWSFSVLRETGIQMLFGYTVSEYWPGFGLSVGILWFLPLLYVSKLIYQTVRRTTPGGMEYRLLLCFILSTAGIILGSRWGRLPWSLDVALEVQFFFIWGELCQRHRERFEKLTGSPWMTALAFCGWLLLTCAFGYSELAFRIYPAGITALPMSCFAVFTVLSAAWWVDRLLPFFSRFLQMIGRHSLLVLCVHTFDKCFLTNPDGRNPWILLPCEILIALLPAVGYDLYLRRKTAAK